MPLPLFPAEKTKRQAGRPPAERLRHLRCLALAELIGLRPDAIAAQEGIGRATVYRWIELAKTYPESRSREELKSAISN